MVPCTISCSISAIFIIGMIYMNYSMAKSKKIVRRKWSMKYKKSINCSRPKGFSQKQYCKYGKRTRKIMI